MPQKYIELPTQEYLQECFEYNPETGILTWKERPLSHFKDGVRQKQAQTRWNNKFNKTKAGRLHINGYIVVHVNSISYPIHRLIWKMITGNTPSEQIDHIDTDRTNNRIENLRDCTNGQNQHNTNLRKTNKSGTKGVHFDNWYGLWIANIGINKKQIRLGRFQNKEDAVKAINDARESYHKEFTNFGVNANV